LRLAGSDQPWSGRGHFFATAAEAIICEGVSSEWPRRNGGSATLPEVIPVKSLVLSDRRAVRNFVDANPGVSPIFLQPGGQCHFPPAKPRGKNRAENFERFGVFIPPDAP
jgi:hypothetical protein